VERRPNFCYRPDVKGGFEHIRGAIWLTTIILALSCMLPIDLAIMSALLDRFHVGGGYRFDFTVFWTAARLPGHNIYDVDAMTRAQLPMTGTETLRPFANPPSFLLLFSPFASLPFWWAFSAWTAAGLASFVLAARKIASPLAIMISLFSPAFVMAVAPGQTSLITGAGIIGGISIARDRPILAGMLVAGAALVKPQAALLVPLDLVAARQWSALLAAAIAGTVALGACLLVQGPGLWFRWVDSLSGFMLIVRDLGIVDSGVTPTSLVHIHGIDQPWATIVIAAGTVLGVATVWRIFRHGNDPRLRIAALLAGGLLCSPYAMGYELAPLMPIAGALMIDRKCHWSGWVCGALLLSYLAPSFSPWVVAILCFYRYSAQKLARADAPCLSPPQPLVDDDHLAAAGRRSWRDRSQHFNRN